MKALLLKPQKIILVLGIILPLVTFAQNEKSGVDKEFTFDETSKSETFTFKVDKNTESLIIDFEGNITQGALRVKIKDPDGNQISGFSLRTSSSRGSGYSYSSSSSSGSSSSSSSSSSSGSISISSTGSNENSTGTARASREARESRTVRESREERERRDERESRSERSRASSRSRSSSRSTETTETVEILDSDSVITKTKNKHIYTNQKTESDNTGARGVIYKEVTNPTEGEWEFTIYPSDASGKLSAKISYK